ncbi:MAG: hypothetical protein FWF03_00270, partial [Defluviitaleaceae bacterium]|nr:hypothetical protein [Defluviitaleaceae bacterium]
TQPNFRSPSFSPFFTYFHTLYVEKCVEKIQASSCLTALMIISTFKKFIALAFSSIIAYSTAVCVIFICLIIPAHHPAAASAPPRFAK